MTVMMLCRRGTFFGQEVSVPFVVLCCCVVHCVVFVVYICLDCSSLIAPHHQRCHIRRGYLPLNKARPTSNERSGALSD